MPTIDPQTTLQQVTALLSTPVLSAIIGGATGVAGSWFASSRTFEREKKHRALATFTAIKAEIQSIVQLMEFADYLKGMQDAIKYIETNKEPYYYYVPVEIELFTKVYSSNVSNLGLLKEKHLPDIVAFYANVHGLVMDLEHFKPKDAPFPMSLENMLQLYKADYERVGLTLRLGRKIAQSSY